MNQWNFSNQNGLRVMTGAALRTCERDGGEWGRGWGGRSGLATPWRCTTLQADWVQARVEAGQALSRPVPAGLKHPSIQK